MSTITRARPDRIHSRASSALSSTPTSRKYSELTMPSTYSRLHRERSWSTTATRSPLTSSDSW
jgi:hypothetical protein